MVGFRASAQILKAVAQAQQKGRFRRRAMHAGAEPFADAA
jgi:hypothetical protein